MLASCPTEIRLRTLLIVGTDGKVGEVRIDPADGVAAAFTSAVRTAVLQWRFEPLVFSRWTVAANHGKRMLEKEAKPFSLRYEFRFACRDGKPQTGAAATGSG